MKKPLFLLALAALPFLCLAQSKAINEFYNKYSQDEHFLDIKLSGGLLNLVASKTDNEDDKRVIRKITALRALVLEEGNMVKKEDYTKLLREAKADSFEELIKVRDGGDNVEILIREKGNAISHVLLLVNGENSFVCASLLIPIPVSITESWNWHKASCAPASKKFWTSRTAIKW